MRPLLPLGAALLVSISGCAIGPDYVRQDPSLPPAFAAASQAASPAATSALEQWWTLFNDEQLSTLVAESLRGNLQIEQSLARLAQARAGVRFARAALLPAGSLSGVAAANQASVETPLGKLLNATPNFDRHGEFYELDAGASWELDLFGGLRRARESADANEQAVVADAQALRLSVAAQTAAAYIGVRSLQARLAVLQERIATQSAARDLIGQQVDQGLVASTIRDQADVTLAQLRASEAPLLAGLSSTRNALDVLLGHAAGYTRDRLAADISLPVAPSIDAVETPGELLRRRPDVVAAERRVAAANARIGQALSEYYPKLSLSALVGSASTSGGQFLGGSAAQAQGALGLRWRLFDFGRVDAGIAAARAQSAQALLAYKLVALTATEEVESALTELTQRQRQSQRLAEGLSHAVLARDAVQRSLQTGLASRLDLLRAQEQVLQLRDAMLQADTAAGFAAVSAYRALGGGWQPQEHAEHAPLAPTPTRASETVPPAG